MRSIAVRCLVILFVLSTSCHHNDKKSGSFSGNQGTDTAAAGGKVPNASGGQNGVSPGYGSSNKGSTNPSVPGPGSGNGPASITTSPNNLPPVNNTVPATIPGSSPSGHAQVGPQQPANPSKPGTVQTSNSSTNTPKAQSGVTRGGGTPGVGSSSGGH